jgi:hypothetical protein
LIGSSSNDIGDIQRVRLSGQLTVINPDELDLSIGLYDPDDALLDPETDDITSVGTHTIRPLFDSVFGVEVASITVQINEEDEIEVDEAPFEVEFEITEEDDESEIAISMRVTDNYGRSSGELLAEYEVALIILPPATSNTMQVTGLATLSGGDLTVTMPGGNLNGARSVNPLAGKRYIEFRTNHLDMMVGVCNENTPFTWNAGSGNSGYYWVRGGSPFNYGLLTGGATTSSANIVDFWCGIAIDVNAKKLWLRDKDGTFWNGDPAAGTGGWAFASLPGSEVRFAVGNGSGGTQNISDVNFGATSFTHTPPTGFNV